ATLYELLTLRPIFEGRDRNELLRQIADEEPRPPRSLHSSVPRELETVVLKALGKEPSERYPTARALADDLQRFLDNRPVLARRAAGRGGRGPLPPGPALRGRDVPHQSGGVGRPARPGRAAQAAALVGPGLLPGVPRTAPRRPRGAGRPARREAACGKGPR